jgi:hypothetical protein
MRCFFIIVALLYCSFALSQTKTVTSDKETEVPGIEGPIGCEERRVISCESVEVDALVKNSKHWLTYLTKNLLLDSLAQDTIPKGIYNIVAFFIIDKEGCITEVKVQNDPGYGLGNKVIRVISDYNIKWNPATRNGRIVKAYKKQVVTIIVENKKCKLQKEIKEFIL